MVDKTAGSGAARAEAWPLHGRGGTLFYKLFLSALLLLAFTLGILDVYLTRFTASRETANVEQRLVSEAHLVAYELGNVPPPILSGAVRQAGARAQARITVITHDGVVLADSEHDPRTMENHARRPEVRQALQGRTGVAVRHSATLGRNLCYVALPFIYHGRSGLVLRLAVPLTEVSNAVSVVRKRIVYASLAMAVLALILAYFFSMRFSRRIHRIQAFAERLLTSADPAPIVVDSLDELGALSRTLNHVGWQLRESMNKLRVEASHRKAILAGMVEGVLAIDRDMRVLFCNTSFAQAIGVDPSSAQQLPLVTILRDSALLNTLESVLATGNPATSRVQLAAAGDRVYIAHAAPLTGQEGSGVVAVLHEITEVERLENIRRDFVANVSHELRTPLAAILGYAETLLDGAMEDSETNRKFLETIKAHAIRLNNISSDLLTLSDLDSGLSRAALSRFSIKEVILTAMRTVEPESQLRKVALVFNGPEDIQIRSYKLRLEQVMVNLLDNAIKFNHPGGEARAEISQTPDDFVKITVADTGSGIPPQDLDRIFERFYRVDRARSVQVGGTGLGLAIVKHAVELMNGRIDVKSDLGKGSIFTLFVPMDLRATVQRPH